MRLDTVWRNARLASFRPGADDIGLVERGAVAALDGRIAFAGPEAELPRHDAASVVDCEGRWITPGLIDCHTHLVFGGNRAREFEQRLQGASYEEIARQGGGILSTVHYTRAASVEELAAEALPRLDALLAEGVTTLEVKSGYALEPAGELRQLRAARELGRRRAVEVSTSFLGAHAVPPEFAGRPDDYVSLLCEAMLPMVAAEGLADAVDAFCERIAFTPAQTARVFAAARRHGLPVKLHADQLGDGGGAALAAAHGALSADHLEYASAEGVAALAAAGTVAVLLPGAYYFLREETAPPVALLRQHGVPMALATDCNPGTSPMTSILLAMNMGATLFRMTVNECLAGTTREAARALGLGGDRGTLEAGKRCDLAIWSVGNLAELVYRIGFNPLHARVHAGQTFPRGAAQ